MILHPLLGPGLVLTAIGCAALILRFSGAARDAVRPDASRDRAIDGLRGYLAIAVFVHHAAITWFFVRSGQWVVPPSRLFTQFGQVGVALFFMVTAYLFWGRVLERQGRLDWTGFAIGRLWRLCPAWLATLAAVLLVVLAAAGWAWQQPARETLRAIWPWLLFTYPNAPDLNGFPGTGRLVAYASWSLPYEMLFYAVLPLAAHAVFRNVPAAVLAVSLGVLAAMAVLAHWPNQFSPYIIASFAGCIFSAHAARRPVLRRLCRSGPAGLVALAALVAVLIGFNTAYRPVATLLLTVFFVVVACGHGLWGALTAAPVIWLGQASYSLYLQHGLVLWLVADRLGGLIDPARSSDLVHTALLLPCCALLVLLASLNTLLVEQPGIAAGRRWRARIRQGAVARALAGGR